MQLLFVFPCKDGAAANTASDDVGARSGSNFANDFFEKLFSGCGHEFGAGRGAAVGEGFFVADWEHAGLDGIGVGEFTGLAGQGLGITFFDFHLPVWRRETILVTVMVL